MKLQSQMRFGAILGALIAYSTSASAAFSAGNSIEAVYLFPNSTTLFSGPAIVSGPSDFLPNYAGWLDVVYTDTSILIQLTRDGGPNHTPFDGVKFTDLTGNLHFENYSVDPSLTTITDFTLTKELNVLLVNFTETTGHIQQTLRLAASPVPVPTSVVMLGSSLGVLGLARRRRRS